jgi:hypothetical protein
VIFFISAAHVLMSWRSLERWFCFWNRCSTLGIIFLSSKKYFSCLVVELISKRETNQLNFFVSFYFHLFVSFCVFWSAQGGGKLIWNVVRKQQQQQKRLSLFPKEIQFWRSFQNVGN